MNIALIIVSGVVIIRVIPIILEHIGKDKKDRREKEIEKIKYQKEILELEVEKEKLNIKLLEEENKKLDKIIYQK
jgi:hypothetical protein